MRLSCNFVNVYSVHASLSYTRVHARICARIPVLRIQICLTEYPLSCFQEHNKGYLIQTASGGAGAGHAYTAPHPMPYTQITHHAVPDTV